MQKPTDLDRKSHQIYVNYMMEGENNYYRKIEFFYINKERFSNFYSEATIKLRKEKLRNINNICIVK